jgi:hypothetical protein
MEEKIILFTLSVDPKGDIHNVTNASMDELPLLYKALRAVENQIFDDISSLVPTPAKKEDGAKVNATDKM